MVTIKEIESDREEYILGYNTCKEDVIKEIDELIEHNESMTDYERDEAVIIVLKELKARFI